jgi:hypothetical protein
MAAVDPTSSPMARLNSPNFPTRASGNFNMTLALSPDPAGRAGGDPDLDLDFIPQGDGEAILLAFRHAQTRCRDCIHKLTHKRNTRVESKWPEYKVDVIHSQSATPPRMLVREEWIVRAAAQVMDDWRAPPQPAMRRPAKDTFRLRTDWVLEKYADLLRLHDSLGAEVDRLAVMDLTKEDAQAPLCLMLYNAKVLLRFLLDLSVATDNAPSKLSEIRQLAGAATNSLASIASNFRHVQFCPTDGDRAF